MSDDEYALSSGNLSLFWSVAADGIYNQAGEKVGNIPNTNGSNMENFAVYWDGDLGRELLDGNKLVKYSIKAVRKEFIMTVKFNIAGFNQITVQSQMRVLQPTFSVIGVKKSCLDTVTV